MTKLGICDYLSSTIKDCKHYCWSKNPRSTLFETPKNSHLDMLRLNLPDGTL